MIFRKVDDKIECLACSWYCKLRVGQRGVCGVRVNVGGKLKSLVYGKVYGGLAIDPIEKKPFYHFLPGTTALSFGTMGCNFGCLFCQNWEISQGIKNNNYNDYNNYKYKASEIVEAAVKNGCESIAYTYNEPAVFVEFAYEVMKKAKKAHLRNVFVSNGYESKESFELIHDYLDGINIDLKGPSEEFYRKFCRARLAPVLESIERFFRAGTWVEVTTMLIEGENDGKKDLEFMANFLAKLAKNIPWHLSAMHPDYKMREGRVTPYSSLERAYKIGREAGLKYVYAYTTEKSTDLDSTFCPRCGELLIERHYFETVVKNFKNGKCGKCGERIEGVWN